MACARSCSSACVGTLPLSWQVGAGAEGASLAYEVRLLQTSATEGR